MQKFKELKCPHCGRGWIVKRDEVGHQFYKFGCGTTLQVKDFTYTKKYFFKCKNAPAPVKASLPYRDD